MWRADTFGDMSHLSHWSHQWSQANQLLMAHSSIYSLIFNVRVQGWVSYLRFLFSHGCSPCNPTALLKVLISWTSGLMQQGLRGNLGTLVHVHKIVLFMYLMMIPLSSMVNECPRNPPTSQYGPRQVYQLHKEGSDWRVSISLLRM